MDGFDRSTRVGVGIAGLGLLALAGAVVAKKVRNAQAQSSIHGSWGEEKSDLDRHPELQSLPPEERGLALAEIRATRLQTGKTVIENAMKQRQDSLMATVRNMI